MPPPATTWQEYYLELVNYLTQGYPPSKICGLIHLCSSSAAETAAPAADNGVECALCEYALAEVESILGNNRSVAAVEAALQKVCNALPRSVASACDDLVATYYPQLVPASAGPARLQDLRHDWPVLEQEG